MPERPAEHKLDIKYKEQALVNSPENPTSQWLTCITALPTDQPASRMRMLRLLESLGCAVMRDGVYLLPDTPQNRQSLSRLCEHVSRAGGSATMMCVTAVDDRQIAQFKQLFDRTAKYEALITTVRSLKAAFGISDPVAISKVLAKQKREFEAIALLDFFPSPAKAGAKQALVDAGMEVQSLMFPDASKAAAGTTVPSVRSYFQQTWATRLPLWTDRLASAWMIRRFIDTEAKLVWLDKLQSPSSPSDITFGFDGASFCNSQTEVTFERLLKHFQLNGNASLKRMALLVHYLEAGGTPVAEAVGVDTLLQGARRRSLNEDELLAECEKTFDLLYDAYCETPSPS